MKTLYACLFIALAVALSGCGTTTSMSSAWKDPDYTGSTFKKLIVLGIGNSEGSTRLFEDEFAAAITASGSSATARYRVLPNIDSMTEAEITKVIVDGNYDGAIVTRLLAIDKGTEYVPPTSSAYRSPYMSSGYYGYYQSSYVVVTEPGYMIETMTVRLETNLYQAGTKKLIWSGHSDTFDPTSVQDAITSITRTVTDKLVADGLIGQ